MLFSWSIVGIANRQKKECSSDDWNIPVGTAFQSTYWTPGEAGCRCHAPFLAVHRCTNASHYESCAARLPSGDHSAGHCSTTNRLTLPMQIKYLYAAKSRRLNQRCWVSSSPLLVIIHHLIIHLFQPQNVSFSHILPSIDIWHLFRLASQISGLLYGFFFVSVIVISFFLCVIVYEVPHLTTHGRNSNVALESGNVQWVAGGTMVPTLDLQSKDHEFDSRSGHYQMVTTWMIDYLPTAKLASCITNTKVNSAFYPPGYVNCFAEVKVRCVYLCLVAGSTVWSYMTGDAP